MQSLEKLKRKSRRKKSQSLLKLIRSNWKRCRSVRWSLTFRCWPSTTSVTTPSIQISTSTLSQWPFWGHIKRRPAEKCLAMEEPDPVSLFCLAELEKVWSALLCAARSGRKRLFSATPVFWWSSGSSNSRCGRRLTTPSFADSHLMQRTSQWGAAFSSRPTTWCRLSDNSKRDPVGFKVSKLQSTAM